jgi:alpha-mannosidase
MTPAALSRFGWGLMSKLEVNEIIPQDRVDTQPRPLAGAQSSFLQIDSANVVLTAWKGAEDGSGSILRLAELNGEASEIKLRSPMAEIEAAWSCDAVERCDRPLTLSIGTVTIPVGPFQIVTVKIHMHERE